MEKRYSAVWGHFVYSGAFVIAGWALKLEKLYAMRKNRERFRRPNEETAAAAILELSNIDTAQEEGVVQQEFEKKSVAPKSLPGKN